MRGRRLEKTGSVFAEYVEDFTGRERRRCRQIMRPAKWHDSDRFLDHCSPTRLPLSSRLTTDIQDRRACTPLKGHPQQHGLDCLYPRVHRRQSVYRDHE